MSLNGIDWQEWDGPGWVNHEWGRHQQQSTSSLTPSETSSSSLWLPSPETSQHQGKAHKKPNPATESYPKSFTNPFPIPNFPAHSSTYSINKGCQTQYCPCCHLRKLPCWEPSDHIAQHYHHHHSPVDACCPGLCPDIAMPHSLLQPYSQSLPQPQSPPTRSSARHISSLCRERLPSVYEVSGMERRRMSEDWDEGGDTDEDLTTKGIELEGRGGGVGRGRRRRGEEVGGKVEMETETETEQEKGKAEAKVRAGKIEDFESIKDEQRALAGVQVSNEDIGGVGG